MSKSKIKVNIEVAIRARPLNNFECRDGEDNAWEIKQGESKKSKTQSAELCDKVIQLKNTFRFGFNRLNDG